MGCQSMPSCFSKVTCSSIKQSKIRASVGIAVENYPLQCSAGLAPTKWKKRLVSTQERSLAGMFGSKKAGMGTTIPMSAWYVLMFPADRKSGRDDALLIIEWKSGWVKAPPWYRQILPLRTFGLPELKECSVLELSSRSIGWPRGVMILRMRQRPNTKKPDVSPYATMKVRPRTCYWDDEQTPSKI